MNREELTEEIDRVIGRHFKRYFEAQHIEPNQNEWSALRRSFKKVAVDFAESLLKDKRVTGLPTDEEVTEWFEINVDGDSASSAIYKFRLWLRDRLQSQSTVTDEQLMKDAEGLKPEYRSAFWTGVVCARQPQSNEDGIVRVNGENKTFSIKAVQDKLTESQSTEGGMEFCKCFTPNISSFSGACLTCNLPVELKPTTESERVDPVEFHSWVVREGFYYNGVGYVKVEAEPNKYSEHHVTSEQLINLFKEEAKKG